MNNNSRTKNAKLNIFYGYIAQIGILVLSFIGRRIFLNYLSADYLGINGLYSNILTLLSLPELGMDMAVIYSLYKPVADNDTKMISSLLKYFRKLYFVLAVVIFLIGISLIPCLKFLITSNLPIKDLVLYYLLFLINTVASYFVAHKVALLFASQEQRVQKLVTLSSNFILQFIYILVLVVFKNYYSYILASVVTTIVTNVVLGFVIVHLHPDVFRETEHVEFDKKPIIERMFSTFLYKIGAVLVNSTDNILISVLVSTVAVGYYYNYSTVVTAVTGFISIITTSMIAAIGNLAAKGSRKEQIDLFDMMVFFYHLIAAMGFIGFSLLFNNLITIWLGSKYLFDTQTVFIIAFNFYISNAIAPVYMFREANGLFNQVKFLLLIRAALNIAFSISLGMVWGVFGIFLATSLSLVLTNFWYEPKLLSDKVLSRLTKVYWIKQAKYGFITLVCYLICYITIYWMDNTILLLVLKAIIVCVVTGSAFVIVNLKTKELQNLKNYVFKK